MDTRRRLSRRTLVGLITGAGALAAVAAGRDPETGAAERSGRPARPADAPRPLPAKSLGALAHDAGLIFGASIADDVFNDPAYRQVYLDQARIVTSDLALKMAILRPQADVADYADADRLVGFAQANHMLFRGHTLVWNENNPDWMKRLDKAAVASLLDRHVETTVARYAGRIHSWDVVNEPFWPGHRAPGGFRKGPWYDALGPAYIGRALRKAAAADPTARLVINEAFTERGDNLGLTVRAALLRLIDDLQHQGVPLHAIGLESHLQPQYPSDDAGFVTFLEAIAARGLDIYLTELDIDDTSLPKDTAARDLAAAQRVHAYLSHALSVPAVRIVECWQLSDRYSWYQSPEILRERRNGTLPRPLPFDAHMRRKPMYDAIARAFFDRPKARSDSRSPT
jgi:endo-1,4-beta-xylanase